MESKTIFSWQKKQWHLLWEAKQANRLPHALLFAGALGLGKMQFAEAFAAALLCEKPIVDRACSVCHACRLVHSKSHPDLIFISPEQAGQVIKIDQIRNMVNIANETAMQGGYKIIIIHPAHAMNQYAANALLKTLEEATPKTLFILISEQNLRLPLTIKSRCQKIIFQKPEKQEALAWLQSKLTACHSNENSLLSSNSCHSSESWNPDAADLELVLNIAEGAPLQALTLIEKGVLSVRQDIYQGLFDLSQNKIGPLQLAARWQEYDVIILFNLLLNWLRDLLRLQLTQQPAMLINYDYQTAFSHVAQGLSQQNLLNYLDIVQERYRQTLSLQNLNKQLLLEELLGSVYNSTMSGVLP